MTLTIGEKVVYPAQGPCLIEAAIERTIDGNPKSFYRLILLVDNGGVLFVPVDKVHTIGVRPLLEKSEIPKVLDRLRERVKVVMDWRQRAAAIVKLFASGSAHDLAEIVELLTELRETRETRELSVRESWSLNRARTLLVCEIAEVLDETRNEAEERVNQALISRVVAVAGARAAGRRQSQL